jgi:hypothetical protein
LQVVPKQQQEQAQVFAQLAVRVQVRLVQFALPKLVALALPAQLVLARLVLNQFDQ